MGANPRNRIGHRIGHRIVTQFDATKARAPIHPSEQWLFESTATIQAQTNTSMKPKYRHFKALLGLTSVVLSCTASAASIDVVTTLAPTNTTNGSGVRGVRALTTNQTWTADNEYFLTDRVFIPAGITLTIQPGTKIYGSINDGGTPTNRADDAVGSLIAARGGRLVAEGTASSPIIFSSIREWEAANGVDSPFDVGTAVGPAPTVADGGQWGGVVLLGNAYVCHLNALAGTNLGNAEIEGFAPAGTPSDDGDGLADATEYGFDTGVPRDDNDDSGVLRYVSIRHGGYEFAPGREINGLTLGGVGAGTVIDHVEVFANLDDGIEFFGGTVSTSYLCLAYNQDDNFDFDSGHTGNHQFLFSIANPGFADAGFEADGIEGTNTTQAAYDAAFTVNPPTPATIATRTTNSGVTLSKPRMFNVTLIGPGRSNVPSTIAQGFGQVLTEKGSFGFIFDDYFNGELYNSVIDDFAQDLAFFRDGDKSYGATARVAYNTLGRFGSAVSPQADTLTAAGNVSTSGNLTVTVTGGLIATTPVSVPVLSGDTPDVWAPKVVTALNANSTINAHYLAASGVVINAVTGVATTTVSLSTKVNAANDATLNIAVANGTAAGVTAVTTSTNAVAGGGSASVNPATATTYFSGVNTLNLFMNNTTGAPTDSNSAINQDPLYTTYTRDSSNFLTAIDPRPASGSPLLKANGATVTAAPVYVTYRGAFGSENWAAGWTKFSTSGVLQGTAPAVDTDGDGITDSVETTNSALGFNSAVSDANTVLGTLKTNAQFTANFTAGQTSVTSNPSAFSLYTAASILDVRSVGQVVVAAPAGPGNVTLTLPVEKSTGLTTWEAAGNMTLSIPKTVDKEFYRITIPE